MTLCRLFMLTVLILTPHGVNRAADIIILHEFAGGADDGQYPLAGLTLVGSTLFGTADGGGDNDLGTIFSINTDGSGFKLLHEFAGAPNDGAGRAADLTLSGSTLFGTTARGGVGSRTGRGTIFSINIDGGEYTMLHAFTGGANDGTHPRAKLTVSGSSLYGTTHGESDTNGVTIFSINTDGSGFTLLHKFAGGADDGAGRIAGLSLSGSTLFGTTTHGGDNNVGTIFSISTDGSAFTLLHEFTRGADDAPHPLAGLTLSGTTLFGTTAGIGGVFSMNTDGSAFTILHRFSGGTDAFQPEAVLTLGGSTLFGTTVGGGDSRRGTVFSIDTDGSGYALLHEFAGGADDGRHPFASLTRNGSTLFGTTHFGGDNDLGTIFSVKVPEAETSAK